MNVKFNKLMVNLHIRHENLKSNNFIKSKNTVAKFGLLRDTFHVNKIRHLQKLCEFYFLNMHCAFKSLEYIDSFIDLDINFIARQNGCIMNFSIV